jgi:hypothetical protein
MLASPQEEFHLIEVTMKRAAWLCLGMCVMATPLVHAQAQDRWSDKAFVNISGGGQAGSHTLDAVETFEIYNELATVTTSQKVGGGGLFDITTGYRVWDNLALGLGYSFTSGSTAGNLAASIPDPVFRNRPRSVTGPGPELSHAEHDIHIAGTWMWPIRPKLDVGLSFGPSIIIVKQEVPDDLTVTEPGPVVAPGSIRNVTATTVGINIGADVAYMVNKRFGVGGLLRYVWGSTDIDGADLTVGGLQVGGGVRIRFEKLPWE